MKPMNPIEPMEPMELMEPMRAVDSLASSNHFESGASSSLRRGFGLDSSSPKRTPRPRGNIITDAARARREQGSTYSPFARVLRRLHLIDNWKKGERKVTEEGRRRWRWRWTWTLWCRGWEAESAISDHWCNGSWSNRQILSRCVKGETLMFFRNTETEWHPISSNWLERECSSSVQTFASLVTLYTRSTYIAYSLVFVVVFFCLFKFEVFFLVFHKTIKYLRIEKNLTLSIFWGSKEIFRVLGHHKSDFILFILSYDHKMRKCECRKGKSVLNSKCDTYILIALSSIN